MVLYSSSSTWICQSVTLLGLYVGCSLYTYPSLFPLLDLVGTDCVVDLSVADRLNRLKISPVMRTFSCCSFLSFSIVFMFPCCSSAVSLVDEFPHDYVCIFVFFC